MGTDQDKEFEKFKGRMVLVRYHSGQRCLSLSGEFLDFFDRSWLRLKDKAFISIRVVDSIKLLEEKDMDTDEEE